jgi:hypothetical protein
VVQNQTANAAARLAFQATVDAVDSAGAIVATWARRRWDPAEIVGQAAALAASAEGDA